MSFKKFLHIVFFSFFALISFANTDENEQIFVNGNFAYGYLKYDQAIENYKILIEKGFTARNLNFNLANAYFKTNQIGKSILYYEKVLKQNPKNKDAAQNLAFVKTKLDNYLHRNTEVADKLLKKIVQAEKERKELSGIRKLARDRAKKASLHNKKLRDCRIHLGDVKKENYLESTLFITEGDSASGSITKSRNVNTQAVFSLKGKPLNSYGLSKKIVYENEEFNLLQAALNIEDGLEDLRYNNIVIATDADVDGMHIRLLLITFFLQFFPEVIKEGHLYILETPLFRVRNKKETFYCYSDEEKRTAIEKLKGKPEITRFKGLGEISPNEFVHFIGDDIRLDPVMLDKEMSIEQMLEFYMGKNTPDRQKFIIENLKVELDYVEE